MRIRKIGKVESATNTAGICAVPEVLGVDEIADDVETGEEFDIDEYVKTLSVEADPELLKYYDDLTWDYDDKGIYIYTVINQGPGESLLTDFTIPLDDLDKDWNTIKGDVQYIVDELTKDAEPKKVESSTAIEGSVQGFDFTFREPTWADMVETLSREGLEVDSAYRREPEKHVPLISADGKHYIIEVTQYFAGDYECRSENMQIDHYYDDVDQCDGIQPRAEVITGSDDDPIYRGPGDDDDYPDREHPDTHRYVQLRSKSVQDSDGFYTDYTMYFMTDPDYVGDRYVMIFGDSDIYNPDNTEPDWECETKEQADEWFDNYNGFEDEFIHDVDETNYDPYTGAEDYMETDDYLNDNW